MQGAEFVITFNEAVKKSMSLFDSGMGSQGVALTPEEIKAVEEAAGLITQEEAEKIARELKVLELDDTFVVDWANLYKNGPPERITIGIFVLSKTQTNRRGL